MAGRADIHVNARIAMIRLIIARTRRREKRCEFAHKNTSSLFLPCTSRITTQRTSPRAMARVMTTRNDMAMMKRPNGTFD